MTIKVQTNASAALSATGLANNATSTGAAYTLTATNCGDGLAHQITFKGDAATNHSGKTITIVGTDADGYPLTEAIAGPNGVATVTTTGYFLTVTSVTPSASTGADTFDIGWNANSVAPSFVVNLSNPNPLNIGVGCTVSTGSPTYSLQYSYDAVTWFTHATITGKTASFDGVVTTPCRKLRMAFTAAGTVVTTYIQHDAR